MSNSTVARDLASFVDCLSFYDGLPTLLPIMFGSSDRIEAGVDVDYQEGRGGLVAVARWAERFGVPLTVSSGTGALWTVACQVQIGHHYVTVQTVVPQPVAFRECFDCRVQVPGTYTVTASTVLSQPIEVAL